MSNNEGSAWRLVQAQGFAELKKGNSVVLGNYVFSTARDSAGVVICTDRSRHLVNSRQEIILQDEKHRTVGYCYEKLSKA